MTSVRNILLSTLEGTIKKKSVLIVPLAGNSGTFLQAACITSNQQSENITQSGSWVLITIKEMDLTCDRNLLQNPDRCVPVLVSLEKIGDMKIQKTKNKTDLSGSYWESVRVMESIPAVTGLNAGRDAESTETKNLFTIILKKKKKNGYSSGRAMILRLNFRLRINLRLKIVEILTARDKDIY